MSGIAWDEEFELPDGSHSVSDIENYFKYIMKYIIKKHGTLTDKPPDQIYVNKI